jgi:hypothetical protein
LASFTQSRAKSSNSFDAPERRQEPEHREMLLNMAETWEALATAREKKLAKGGEMGDD